MSLLNKLCLLIIIPITVLSMLHILENQRIISGFKVSLMTSRNDAIKKLVSDIHDVIFRLDQTTVNLSRPREIVNAILDGDNEALYDWSAAFTGQIDTIIFIDTDGMVLARAPDEFRFGDEVTHLDWFDKAWREGTAHGVAIVDGKASLFSARRVYKYADIPAGLVCVAMTIDPNFLSRFVDREQMVLSFNNNGKLIESASSLKPVQDKTVLNLSYGGFNDSGMFSVKFFYDDNYKKLKDLRRSFIINGISTVVITFFIIVIILFRQFGPYSTIVNGVLAYSRDQISLDTLRDRLVALQQRHSKEINRIADSLIKMVDTIKLNLERIEEYTVRLKKIADTDALTGLHNRKSMDEILASEANRSQRYKSPLSLLIMDIDHFKRVNDTHGHPVGDEVLKSVASVLKNNSRKSDFIGRWGGEEFIAVSPGVGTEDAITYGQKLCSLVAEKTYAGSLKVTISIGVAHFRDGESIHTLITRADQALYAAKEAGRNCVISES